MSSQLTLKEKIELFKLSKKPRKQIKLRFDTLTMDLNLPSLHPPQHLNYKHFHSHHPDFNPRKHVTYHAKVKYKTEGSIRNEESLLKLKNQLFRQKLLGQDLRNRKHAGTVLRQLSQENNHWLVNDNAWML